MKKNLPICAAFAALALFVGCATTDTDVAVDKTVLTTVDENYDFIYEVVNESSKKLLVAPFIKQYLSQNNSKIIANAAGVEIETGRSYQFKYNLKTLKKFYGQQSTIGTDISGEGEWIFSGWENVLSVENQKHTVKITDSVDSPYPISWVNDWDYINVGLLEQNENDYDFIYEIVNNTSGKMTVAPYLRNTNTNKYIAKTSNVVLEKGETYQFKFKLDEVKSAFGKTLWLGSFFAPHEKGRCSGWEGALTTKNKKHIVICKDATDPNYCMDAENKWENLE